MLGAELEKNLKIRRIPLPKDTLLQMSQEEPAFFLLAGHMQNELNSLNKIFSWCLNNSNANERSPIESLADGTQAMIYARILAGKLCEAWKVLGKAFFSTKLSQRVEANLHPTAKHALKKIKLYFGKTNSIHRVRNSLAFHYSKEQFDIHWEEAADEPNFELILGGTVGNNLSLAGEIVANMALLNGINSDNKSDALRAFFDEVQSITSSFTDFLEGTILAIIEERFGSDLAAHGRDEDIIPSQSYNEVKIPFFVNPMPANESTYRDIDAHH